MMQQPISRSESPLSPSTEQLAELIRSKKFEDAIDSLRCFPRESHLDIALQMADAGIGVRLFCRLDEFKGVEAEPLVQMLVERGNYKLAEAGLSFCSKLPMSVAEQLFRGNAPELARHIDAFEGLDNEVANSLLRAGFRWDVLRSLSRFVGLDQSTALLLIQSEWEAARVMNNIDRFSVVDAQALARVLIVHRAGNVLTKNLHLFPTLDHNQIALDLVATDQCWAIKGGPGGLRDLPGEVADFLLRSRPHRAESLVGSLGVFRESDRQEVAEKLLKVCSIRNIFNSIEAIEGIDHDAILRKGTSYIREDRLLSLNVAGLRGLSAEAAGLLIDHGQASAVAAAPESFVRLGWSIGWRLLIRGHVAAGWRCIMP